MAPGGVVAQLQPTCRSRRAGSPGSARSISIAVASFGFSLPYLVASGFGIGTRVWMLE